VCKKYLSQPFDGSANKKSAFKTVQLVTMEPISEP